MDRKALVQLRVIVSNHKLWSKLEDIFKLFMTKGYVQFAIPMKLSLQFTFSAISQNISHLLMNFSLKYRVIP